MADGAFLNPFIIMCGGIAAFLGFRHQHLSGLIRTKAGDIVKTRENEEIKESNKEDKIKCCILQINLFCERNMMIRISLSLLLLSGFIFALSSCLYQFIGHLSFILIVPGIIILLTALCFAVLEFSLSQRTIDLEIYATDSTLISGKRKCTVEGLLKGSEPNQVLSWVRKHILR